MAAVAVAGLANPAAAADWLRLESQNFEVYTDAGENQGRRAIHRFEQTEQAFRGLGSGGIRSSLPVRVYLFETEAEYKVYRPSELTVGFYRGTAVEDYIVMLASAPNVWQVARHEYVHALLDHSLASLPRWLEEGTAEFYSTLEVEDASLVLGRPIANHRRTLSRERWLTAAELAGFRRAEAGRVHDDQAGIFYAQSWALAHMLQMSPGYQPGNRRLAELLDDGAPAPEAFEKAFGKSLDDALEDLRRYTAQRRWPERRLPWEPQEEVQVRVEPLTEAQADAARLDLQLALGLWEVSEQRLRRLAEQRGETPEIESARALIAMSKRDFDGAKQHFARSIELGASDPATYFEYAMLLRDAGEDPTEVQRLLERTVELNPLHAEAQFLLGAQAGRNGRTGDAIERLEQAVRVQPRRSYIWHALATAYWKNGERDNARRAAARSVQSARTDDEMEMAQAALSMVEQPLEPAPRPSRPEVTTPESWQGLRGDARLEGRLVEIECLDERAVLHIETQERRWRLLVSDPTAITLRGMEAASFEFACGATRSAPVVVEYRVREDADTKTSGDVAALEFLTGR